MELADEEVDWERQEGAESGVHLISDPPWWNFFEIQKEDFIYKLLFEFEASKVI